MSKEILDVSEIRIKVLQLANVPTWPLERVIATAEEYFKFVMNPPITETEETEEKEYQKSSSKVMKAKSGNSDILS